MDQPQRQLVIELAKEAAGQKSASLASAMSRWARKVYSRPGTAASPRVVIQSARVGPSAGYVHYTPTRASQLWRAGLGNIRTIKETPIKGYLMRPGDQLATGKHRQYSDFFQAQFGRGDDPEFTARIVGRLRRMDPDTEKIVTDAWKADRLNHPGALTSGAAIPDLDPFQATADRMTDAWNEVNRHWDKPRMIRHAAGIGTSAGAGAAGLGILATRGTRSEPPTVAAATTTPRPAQIPATSVDTPAAAPIPAPHDPDPRSPDPVPASVPHSLDWFSPDFVGPPESEAATQPILGDLPAEPHSPDPRSPDFVGPPAPPKDAPEPPPPVWRIERPREYDSGIPWLPIAAGLGAGALGYGLYRHYNRPGPKDKKETAKQAAFLPPAGGGYDRQLVACLAKMAAEMPAGPGLAMSSVESAPSRRSMLVSPVVKATSPVSHGVVASPSRAAFMATQPQQPVLPKAFRIGRGVDGSLPRPYQSLYRFWNAQPGTAAGDSHAALSGVHAALDGRGISEPPIAYDRNNTEQSRFQAVRALATHLHGREARGDAASAAFQQGYPAAPYTQSSVKLLRDAYRGATPNLIVSNHTPSGDAGFYDRRGGPDVQFPREVPYVHIDNPRAIAYAARRTVLSPPLAVRHELEHARQAPDTAGVLQSPTYGPAVEIPPSLADVVYTGEEFQRHMGRPLQHQVNLTPPNTPPGHEVSHDINWMQQQARRHGLFDGKSMTQLLATPEGQQYLKRIVRGYQAAPQQ